MKPGMVMWAIRQLRQGDCYQFKGRPGYLKRYQQNKEEKGAWGVKPWLSREQKSLGLNSALQKRESELTENESGGSSQGESHVCPE